MKDSQMEGRSNFIIMLLGLYDVSPFAESSLSHHLTFQPQYKMGRALQGSHCIAGRGALDPARDGRGGRCRYLFDLESILTASVASLEMITSWWTDRR